MFFLFFLFFLKHYIPWPYHVTPAPDDIFHRMVCRGWSCNEKLYPSHQSDEFIETIDMYMNGTLVGGLETKLLQLIRRDFHPSLCAVGFFEMIGVGGFQQNLTRAFIDLTEGSKRNLWSCIESLSFHPFTQEPLEYARKSAAQGGIWSMMRLALETDNITESVNLLKHLATVMSSSWWRRRKSGIEYSDAIGTILNLNSKNKTEAWETIDRLSNEGHLPAAIWAAEGLQTGEIGRQNLTEAKNILLPFVISGPWKIDLSGVFKSKDSFDRNLLLIIASQLGNNDAKSLLSFPKLYEY